MREKIIITAVAFGIFFLAAFFRFYGGNWDQNQHLHPDERFLTMVANGIAWPNSFAEYLDTQNSPLNPHNRGFGFFVYGTFPVFFTKWVAESMGLGDYNNLTLTGRQLSALFDLGTVVLVFLIAKSINSIKPSRGWQAEALSESHDSPEVKRSRGSFISDFGFRIFPLLSMFFYTCMVLPIQLSHFYAVETYLTFFITLSFYLLIRSILNSQFSILNSLLLGVSFGLAMASKITALLFLPIIGLGLLFFLFKTRNLLLFFVICSSFFISSYFTLRLAQPYLFAQANILDITLNQKVLNNLKELRSFDGPDTWFPPGVQWITTKPYIFPLKNIIYWGLGLPLATISIIAIIYQILNIVYYVSKRKLFLILNSKFLILTISLLWILILFLYQGAQFPKNMRYFIPIYPFLAIISGYFVHQHLRLIEQKFRCKIGLLGYWVIGLLVIIYPVSFMSLYSHSHSRVTASEWIYKNIPLRTTLAGEHWDDFIPVGLNGKSVWSYKPIELPLYGADTIEKWKDVDQKLKEVEYIILSSNRLYGSIMTMPKRYPTTYHYYQALFDGSLGFSKVAEFTSRPNIPLPFIKICLTPPFARYGIVAKKNQECPLPGISFVDDYADESFTVYDHPKVVIFKKVKPENYFDILFKAQ